MSLFQIVCENKYACYFKIVFDLGQSNDFMKN